jgi:tRNA 2-thiouridine synthesizing protein E
MANMIVSQTDEGYLHHFHDWSPEIATQIAATHGLTLTPEHWCVIHYLRAFYEEYQTHPITRMILHAIEKNEKSHAHQPPTMPTRPMNSSYFYQLFPPEPLLISAKIAGLPKPKRCLKF